MRVFEIQSEKLLVPAEAPRREGEEGNWRLWVFLVFDRASSQLQSATAHVQCTGFKLWGLGCAQDLRFRVGVFGIHEPTCM